MDNRGLCVGNTVTSRVGEAENGENKGADTKSNLWQKSENGA